MGKLRRTVLGISAAETSFERRRFRCDRAEVRERLEEIGRTFVYGYHAALETGRLGPLARRLDDSSPLLRGFVYEGAAMALTLLDALTPWGGRRLGAFLAGPAAPHTYLAHVGAGWALARLPLSPARLRARLDPLAGWLTLDGYGFHQGFFHAPRAIGAQQVPRRLRGYERRAFDQGLGRSLWFVEGASPARIAAAIAAFPPARRPDLWSGVGLACAYAGGLGEGEIEQLREAAGPAALDAGQGAAFAAEARVLAGNVAPHTELACAVLCGCSAAAASTLTREAYRDLERQELNDLDDAAQNTPYERWRQHVRRRLAPAMAQPALQQL
jgi:hypothetical protein